MIILAHTTRRIAASLAIVAVGISPTAAQFVAVNNYGQPTATGPQARPSQPLQVAANPAANYGAYRPAPAQAPPSYQAPPVTYQSPPVTYQAPPAPAYQQPPVYPQAPAAAQPVAPQQSAPRQPAQPSYSAAPVAVYPPQRVASLNSQPVPVTNTLPTPPEVTSGPVQVGPSMGMDHSMQPVEGANYAYGSGMTSGCTTGDCNQGVGYSGYSAPMSGCATGDCGGACDLGGGACRPRRQWFFGLYGLWLQRNDTNRIQVAYQTDTTGFTGGTDYYYQPTDIGVFSDTVDLDDAFGAEVRFGSTLGGCDPCGCGPRFAWELGYWAIDDTDGSYAMSTTVGSTNPDRIYGTIDYSGLTHDVDGAGPTGARDANDYNDYGVPADGDVTANDVRIVAIQVRRRFQAQNLELNFWRFGTPACGSACGVGGCGVGGCGSDGCGVGGGRLGIGARAACRPPRRFFMNGVCGIRYFRIDDDLAIDRQFAVVDGAGDPTGSWSGTANGYDPTSNAVVFHDIDANNELIGFQLGCSMNWLVGCKWNIFADSNFGIYGNDMEVYQRVTAGGAATITYDGGGDVVSRTSDTTVAFLGELRAGIGYQVTCNCRVTAAYRFIGVGGIALSDTQIPDAGYANPNVVGVIDSNNSLILHGLQTGVEWKF